MTLQWSPLPKGEISASVLGLGRFTIRVRTRRKPIRYVVYLNDIMVAIRGTLKEATDYAEETATAFYASPETTVRTA